MYDADVNYPYYGFIGKILKINLSNKSVSEEELNFEYCKDFLGGAGYACRYLYNLIHRDFDPLSKDNIFMVMTGPFCLTNAPAFSRFVICSKSPYTGLWGESNCGGSFGPELKKAGYDGIIITGKADTPIFIKIIRKDIEILDASFLWGKGIKTTAEILKNSIEPTVKVLCIGQAGESLIKYSNVSAEGRFAGRTGMGAIMGSKNLKAIVIKGNNIKPNIKNPLKFKSIVKKTLNFLLNTNTTKILKSYGTSAGILSAHAHGDLPIKYWSLGEWEDVNHISGEKLKENHLIKSKSCYGCPIGCGRIININDKRFSFPECEGPEYETIAGFGSMILNNNLESIAIANNLCNDYGLDTISTSSTIALLFNLYNKGKIKEEEIDGLRLNWGNSEAMLHLIRMIAHREGIGRVLAEGSDKVGDFFKISKEQIATINKLEVPYHDMRACYGMALAYAFSPRGPCHTSADVFKILRKSNECDFSSIGIKKMDLHSNNKKMAKSTIRLQDYRAIYSSLISCFFSNPPPSYIAELINNLLGFNFDIKEIKLIGERIFNMKRLFNIKMGLSATNDFVPKILMSPTDEGAVKGKAPNFAKLKNYYYKIRDWDPITGTPNSEKLKKLGLINLV